MRGRLRRRARRTAAIVAVGSVALGAPSAMAEGEKGPSTGRIAISAGVDFPTDFGTIGIAFTY